MLLDNRGGLLKNSWISFHSDSFSVSFHIHNRSYDIFVIRSHFAVAHTMKWSGFVIVERCGHVCPVCSLNTYCICLYRVKASLSCARSRHRVGIVAVASLLDGQWIAVVLTQMRFAAHFSWTEPIFFSELSTASFDVMWCAFIGMSHAHIGHHNNFGIAVNDLLSRSIIWTTT